MSHAPLRKTALSVALLSMGLAVSAMAQSPGTSTPGTTGRPAATTPGGSPTDKSASHAMSTDKPASRGASDVKLTHAERKFMEDAAKGGMAEVQLGQLAAQKAQSPEVKQFGQKMVDDHTKANDQLKQIATSKGVELPADIDSAARREHDRLSKMSGADFDNEFMKYMVSDHKKVVKEFTNEAKSGKDADVKQFASSTLPTLQEHLQLAQQTDAAVRSASRSSNTMHTSGSTSGSSKAAPASGGGSTARKSGT